MVERVRGVQAGGLVVDNVYRWSAASLWYGGETWGFARCLDLARSCEVYRFSRPWTLGREDTLALIEAYLGS